MNYWIPFIVVYIWVWGYGTGHTIATWFELSKSEKILAFFMNMLWPIVLTYYWTEAIIDWMIWNYRRRNK